MKREVDLKDEIIALLTRHQSKLRGEMREIADGIVGLESLQSDQLEALRRRIHTMKGSSGTLGYASIQHAANALEQGLSLYQKEAASAGALSELHGLTLRLGAAVAEARIEDSTLLQRADDFQRPIPS